MVSVLDVGLSNALAATALAVIAFAVGRFRRNAPLVHCLWLLVLVKLVTPPLIPVPVIPWPSRPAPIAHREPTSRELSPPDSNSTSSGSDALDFWMADVKPAPPKIVTSEFQLKKVGDQVLVVPIVVNAVDEELAAGFDEFVAEVTSETALLPRARKVVTIASSPGLSPGGIHTFVGYVLFLSPYLAIVWLTGSLGIVVLAAVRVGRFEQLLKQSAVTDSKIQAAAQRLANMIGLARCPDIFLVPAVVSPMLWPFGGRARILFPKVLWQRLDELRSETLLLHELAHYRRRDHWVRLLELVTTCLFWWNPVLWCGRRQLRMAEEECCDAEVVAQLPGSETCYASAVLETLDFVAEGRPVFPPAASTVTRVGSAKRRLTLIMQGSQTGRLTPRGRCVVAGVALLLLPLLPTRFHWEPSSTAVAAAPSKGDRLTTDAESRAQAAPLDGREAEAHDPVEFDPQAASLWFDESRGRKPEEDPQVVLSVTHSPNGELLAVAGDNRTVTVRDAGAGTVTSVLRGHTDAVTCVAFSPTGKELATASFDRTVRIWDPATGQQQQVLVGHTNWVFSVAFTLDGKTIATGGYDRTVRLWSLEMGREQSVLRGHAATVRCLSVSPDGLLLASGSSDRTIKLWDLRTRLHKVTLKGHRGAIRDVAFSPDGGRLASASEDGTVKLWDVAACRECATLSSDGEMVWCLAYSPGGRTLVSGSFSGVIKVWDPFTGQERTTLRGHRDVVTSLSFHARTGALVSGSYDKSLRLWRPKQQTFPVAD